jgi:tetratricopeptide (TPR) repeat protein
MLNIEYPDKTRQTSRCGGAKMKSCWRISGRLTLTLLLAFVTTPVLAQSQNPQATNWLKIGLNQKDPQRKIAAYMKAIEADPLFVEALYNLGLTYNKQQDYPRAEQYLLRAYNAKPDRTANDAKLKILYALVVVYKNLGRPDRAEATLAQAKNFAGDDKASAALSAELAQLYYEQNRYEAALTELQTSIRLNPENQSKFAGLMESLRGTLELQRLYESAAQARRSGDLDKARTLFAQIRARNAGFKDVQAQLAELEARQRPSEVRPAAASRQTTEGNRPEADKETAALYDNAKRYEAEGNYEQAIAAYEKLMVQSGFYEDARARLQELKQKLEQSRRENQLEEQYAAGMAALKTQDWARAVIIFEQIIAAQRDFRDVLQRRAEAQNGLERESTATMLARFYAEGKAALQRDDPGAALAAFEKVQKIDPNYRNVSTRIAEVESALEKRGQPASPVAATSNLAAATVPVDSLYQVALAAMVKEDWMQAAHHLEKLQVLRPNYRDVPDLLARTRVRLNLAAKTDVAAAVGSTSPYTMVLYIGGGFFALLILGSILFSPAARARIHIWRGNPVAAEEIYENILARYPQRVNLYPQLAELYLNEGRNDEYAMKIYKKALQLNLPDHKRKALRAFVTQNYLEDGKTNGDS